MTLSYATYVNTLVRVRSVHAISGHDVSCIVIIMPFHLQNIRNKIKCVLLQDLQLGQQLIHEVAILLLTIQLEHAAETPKTRTVVTETRTHAPPTGQTDRPLDATPLSTQLPPPPPPINR